MVIMSVCMYLCMYVCMMYLCMHVFMLIHTYVCSTYSFPKQQWHEMTSDLIESEIDNPPASKTTENKRKILIKLHFVNKGMGMISISKITNEKNVKKTYLHNFKKHNKFQQYIQ